MIALGAGPTMSDNTRVHQLHPNLDSLLPVLCLSLLDQPVHKFLSHKARVVGVEMVLAVLDEIGSITPHPVGGGVKRGEGGRGEGGRDGEGRVRG